MSFEFLPSIVEGSHRKIVYKFDSAEDTGAQEKAQHAAHRNNYIQSASKSLPAILISR